ncbi:MAG: AtpZ/AtpI family protein [Alphaproteobacteria bacterium]|nr:AtpZ/AtpI family protein [Alphaproteobacteria bacterium]
MSDESALGKLKRQIQEAKKGSQLNPPIGNKTPATAGKFFNVGIELVSGVFVGVGLGLLTDWAFGISPWGLISFFILGSAAGMLNIYRTLTRTEKTDSKKDKNV